MQLKPRAYSKKPPQRLERCSSSDKSAVKGRLFSKRTAQLIVKAEYDNNEWSGAAEVCNKEL